MCNEKVLKIDEKYFNINIYFLRENDQNTFFLGPLAQNTNSKICGPEYQDDTPH